MIRTALSLVLLLSVSGCFRRPPEAPKKLDDLTQFLYENWDNEDPEVLSVGLGNLQDFLGSVDLEASVLDRSWELTPLSQAAADTMENPGRDPADTLGVAIARASIWPTEDHARLQIERDQTITEPSAKEYVRSFPEENKPECFVDAKCEILVTANVVSRSNLLMKVTGDLDKEFRWVTLEDGSMAFLSRSSIPTSWIGEGESSKIWQSFSVDVWLPAGKKSSVRFQTLWSESEVTGASDKATIATVKSSTDGLFKANDEAIEELYK